jgi:hypothetical protein
LSFACTLVKQFVLDGLKAKKRGCFKSIERIPWESRKLDRDAQLGDRSLRIQSYAEPRMENALLNLLEKLHPVQRKLSGLSLWVFAIVVALTAISLMDHQRPPLDVNREAHRLSQTGKGIGP